MRKAAVIDLFSRRVADALMMAIWRRGKPDALLRGEQFQKRLADHGVACGMSRSGNVWDNAAMGRFFSSLKTQPTARKVYRTGDQARGDVFDDIERFYNRGDATRPSAISALWISSGMPRQLKVRVHQTGSSSLLAGPGFQEPQRSRAKEDRVAFRRGPA